MYIIRILYIFLSVYLSSYHIEAPYGLGFGKKSSYHHISNISCALCIRMTKRSICQISEHPGRHAFRGGGFKVGGGIFFFFYQGVTSWLKATKMMGLGGCIRFDEFFDEFSRNLDLRIWMPLGNERNSPKPGRNMATLWHLCLERGRPVGPLGCGPAKPLNIRLGGLDPFFDSFLQSSWKNNSTAPNRYRYIMICIYYIYFLSKQKPCQ